MTVVTVLLISVISPIESSRTFSAGSAKSLISGFSIASSRICSHTKTGVAKEENANVTTGKGGRAGGIAGGGGGLTCKELGGLQRSAHRVHT